MARRRRGTTTVALLAATILCGLRGARADDPAAPDVARRLVDTLSGRLIEDWPAVHPKAWAGAPGASPSLRDVFRSTVGAVPFVVSQNGSGTAVVVAVDKASAWVVTNRHVVEKPFDAQGRSPYVMLLFYEPQLVGEIYDAERLERCLAAKDQGPWCQALQRSLRSGRITAVDAERDLALLRVSDLPAGVAAIREATLEGVAPGDDVAVIGHPRGFLWTLTKGIVSAVRPRYPLGRSLGTVIQTQAPVSEGSSGGPLLTTEGTLLGVVSWVVPDAQGLNAAIGIDEVRAFTARHATGR